MGILYHLNVGFGDASIIMSGSATFLIDCHRIEDYASRLPQDKQIRAVFITHQHRDHFSGLEYLKNNNYKIEFLIYSPYDRRYGDNSVEYEEWSEFISYKEYFGSKGTKQFAPNRQEKFDKPWWSNSGVDFWILGPSYYIAKGESRELHDASLVILAEMGLRRYLFAGDASDKNLEDISDTTSDICRDILHASHHGSLEGASVPFIKKCNMNYTVISTESGVHENVPHPTALRRYKENTKKQVYRTDIDGTLQWTF